MYVKGSLLLWQLSFFRRIKPISWNGNFKNTYKFQNNTDLHNLGVLIPYFARRAVIAHYFTFMWPCIVTNFFVIKPNRCTSFTNLCCHETLHVSNSSSVHHQEYSHCTLSNGICHTGFVDSFRAGPSWSCSKANKHIMRTDEQIETCRVTWQNKFVKLVHLIGFITEKKDNPLLSDRASEWRTGCRVLQLFEKMKFKKNIYIHTTNGAIL
jgi:hypothetical protein